MTVPIQYDMLPSVWTTGGTAKVVGKFGEGDFKAKISSPLNDWINIDDHERYIVGAESFGSSATQWRREQVQGPYVAGKYLVNAVPDLVTENVTVYVLGASQTELQANLANLIDAVSQLAWQLVWSVDEAAYTWECESADYTIDFVNANVYARTVAVKLQIPRQPTITLGPVY